jgi:hypothetical protein
MVVRQTGEQMQQGVVRGMSKPTVLDGFEHCTSIALCQVRVGFNQSSPRLRINRQLDEGGGLTLTHMSENESLHKLEIP